MLIPRFSLRWLLAAMTVCGVLAYLLAQAIMGESWGIAISVALGSLLITAVIHVVVFVVAWGLGSMGQETRKKRAASPFATHTPPPQILPPSDPL
jgi:hypothetical protein